MVQVDPISLIDPPVLKALVFQMFESKVLSTFWFQIGGVNLHPYIKGSGALAFIITELESLATSTRRRVSDENLRYFQVRLCRF